MITRKVGKTHFIHLALKVLIPQLRNFHFLFYIFSSFCLITVLSQPLILLQRLEDIF